MIARLIFILHILSVANGLSIVGMKTKTRNHNRLPNYHCLQCNNFVSNARMMRTSYIRTTELESTMLRAFSRESYTAPKLSIVIPAYNEKDRIEQTLIDYTAHLEKCSDFLIPPTEILIVDDGSTDGTCSEVYRVAKNLDFTPVGKELILTKVEDVDDCATSTPTSMISPTATIECIRLPKNSGKGAAITEGCLRVHDKSTVILTADADGSGSIESLQGMITSLHDTILSSSCSDPNSSPWDTSAMLVGVRMYDEEAAVNSETSMLSISSSPILRSIFRWGFRATVKTICFPYDLGVQDTQCGLKLMTTKTAKLLYPKLHLKRWTHDVELLFIAQQLGSIIICEKEIGWVDKEGSKFIETPGGTIKVIFQMLSDVWKMRLQYIRGEWTV